MFRPRSTGQTVAKLCNVRRLLCLAFGRDAGGHPANAHAVTLDQVVALAHAGVTDTVILALIDRDKTIFAIEPEQLVALQRDGVSEAVILAMLKSGRAGRRGVGARRLRLQHRDHCHRGRGGPEMVVVGHGPEVPNTPHVDGFYSGPSSAGYYAAIPYAYPSFRYRSVLPHRTAAQPIGRPSVVRGAVDDRDASAPSPNVRR